MQELQRTDLGNVVRRIPKDVRDLLSKFHGNLFLGGGFIRAVVANESPSDIDLFGTSKDLLIQIAKELQQKRGGEKSCKLHHTKNAITAISIGRITVQFITRWTFSDANKVAESFDFTVCQAVISRIGSSKTDGWSSFVSDRFYTDLAARRVVYTAPVREEEAGGSLLRAIKYVKKGYSIQIDALAGIVARLNQSVREDTALNDGSEAGMAKIYSGLLREVDPLIQVDGLELTDDHEAPDADFGLSQEASE